MSYDVEVYFNAPKSFDDLISFLEGIWGINFKRSEEFKEAVYKGLGLSVIVVPNYTMVDNIGIPFSNFHYEILVKTYVRQTGSHNLVRSLALWIAHQLHERFNWPCIVVEEEQELILELNPP